MREESASRRFLDRGQSAVEAKIKRRSVRAKDPRLGIILMSGYPHSFEMHNAGFELLRKPFGPGDLEAALRHAASGTQDGLALGAAPANVPDSAFGNSRI